MAPETKTKTMLTRPIAVWVPVIVFIFGLMFSSKAEQKVEEKERVGR